MGANLLSNMIVIILTTMISVSFTEYDKRNNC